MPIYSVYKCRGQEKPNFYVSMYIELYHYIKYMSLFFPRNKIKSKKTKLLLVYILIFVQWGKQINTLYVILKIVNSGKVYCWII